MIQAFKGHWSGFHPVLRWSVVLCASLVVFTAIGALVDQRLVAGQGVWVKPFKFALSIAVYLVTIGVICREFDVKWRDRYSVSFSALMALEMIIIVTQAVRGVPSHHNISTPLNATLYTVMGVSIAF